MRCPRCENTTLDERDRDGVTVDICRQCRGIWLDRGELEKIISRTASEMEAYERASERGRWEDDRDRDDSRDRREHGSRDRHKRRKRSWFESLGDIFD